MIIHVTTLSAWESQAQKNHFAPDAFAMDGFIHCCASSQLTSVLERYFSRVDEVLLLHIDDLKLTSPLRYESASNQEKFPHIYGVINKEAIVRIEEQINKK